MLDTHERTRGRLDQRVTLVRTVLVGPTVLVHGTRVTNYSRPLENRPSSLSPPVARGQVADHLSAAPHDLKCRPQTATVAPWEELQGEIPL